MPVSLDAICILVYFLAGRGELLLLKQNAFVIGWHNFDELGQGCIPIIEDARHPQKYRMLMPMVDTVFADVAQPDQARILGLNASYFVKNRGNFIISIKASCVDSTKPPEVVFASEIESLKEQKFRPVERISLEPYERDHIVVSGMYRPAPEDFPQDN